ncbi:hypothetical protein yc1106_10110 [Curvularia clavata]|uniref:Uncharacterized protein n=1 Tax=Curvularia clavata TaxID=95742 RepID=A0A9Q9DYP1_CURCL|nr:hypothetical protein yc1106_10110 [Curvularia clavata]
MNATDFTTIDATKWATFLNQTTEQVATWDATAKHRMFSLLNTVLVERSGPLVKRADTTRAIARADIQDVVAKYDNQVKSDEAADQGAAGCIKSITCSFCVGAAGSLAIGAMAGCANAAYAAVAAASAIPGGEIAYTPIALTLIQCVSTPFAGFLSGAAVCFKATGN